MKKFWLWLVPLIIVSLVSAGIVVGMFVAKNKSSGIVFATNLNCKYESLTFYLNETYTLTNNEFNIEPKNCTQRVLFNSENSTVFEIDAVSGKVTPKSQGSSNLIAIIKSAENDNITIKVPVNVTKRPVSSNQTTTEKHLTFSLSDGFGVIDYDTNDSFENIDYSITSGADCVEVTEHSYKHIFVSFLKAGSATIVVDTPSVKILFYITIE